MKRLKRRMGIYSGTFDPIHIGHLAFAKEAMRLCGLNEVVFLPEPKPRGKGTVTSMAHRVAMIARATKATPTFRVTQLASEQFTEQQTLPELRQLFGDSNLVFLIGSDIARTFLYRWEGLDTLLNEVSFAIGLRAGDKPAEIKKIMDQIAHDYDVMVDYSLIAAPEAHVASSQIREGAVGLSRLHPSTLKYIQEHKLYNFPNNI